MAQNFYDRLAPYYHLLFEDWDASIRRQGEQLASTIRSEWGSKVRTVLDAACGIGTQALGLTAFGYTVSASDISMVAVRRAKEEARSRGLRINTSVADLRNLSYIQDSFDLVIVCDNALPHLLSDDEILSALRECYRCTGPGGGCLLSVRDYADRPSGQFEFHPYGVRIFGGKRYVLFQVWEWHDMQYDLTFCIMEDTGKVECHTHVFRSTYYSISVVRVLELMVQAGFKSVRRIDDQYYQPLLVGSRDDTV